VARWVFYPHTESKVKCFEEYRQKVKTCSKIIVEFVLFSVYFDNKITCFLSINIGHSLKYVHVHRNKIILKSKDSDSI